ncbi:MAG: hypothetical protein M1827_007015 [Pycnora praestabilis]|nr:MAG: hypothetical protein M1827_007015 [Pycnora praestabilis]
MSSPSHHLHSSVIAEPNISPPSRATTAPAAQKRSHLHRDPAHKHHHRHHNRDKSIPQSAVQLNASSSFTDFGLRRVGTRTSAVDTTPAGSVWGSRRGSLHRGDGAAENGGSAGKRENVVVDEGQIKREVERGKVRNEELRTTLSALSHLSTSTTRRLDNTYYSILGKVSTLHSTISSLQEISTLIISLYRDFLTKSEALESDVTRQINESADFDEQQDRIETLESRVKISRSKASDLGSRLEDVRSRVEGWERREGEWQAKTSRRLRMLWSCAACIILLSVAVCVFRHSEFYHTRLGQTRTLQRQLPNSSLQAFLSTSIPQVKKGIFNAREAVGVISSSLGSEAQVTGTNKPLGIGDGGGGGGGSEGDTTLRLFDEL